MRRALTILAAIQDSADNIIETNLIGSISRYEMKLFVYERSPRTKTRKSQVFRAERNIGMRWIKG